MSTDNTLGLCDKNIVALVICFAVSIEMKLEPHSFLPAKIYDLRIFFPVCRIILFHPS